MTMRWLTAGWATGELADEEWEQRINDYRAHNVAIVSRLSHGAEQLIAEVNLHDGQINRFEPDGNDFVLRSLIGDNQVGYEFVTLRYGNAALILAPGRSIKSLKLSKRSTEVLYDEVDVIADGRFSHNVLLSTGDEFELIFDSLHVYREPTAPDSRR